MNDKLKQFTARFRIPKETWKDFKAVCRENGDKPSEVLRALVSDWVSKHLLR